MNPCAFHTSLECGKFLPQKETDVTMKCQEPGKKTVRVEDHVLSNVVPWMERTRKWG